MRSVQVQSIVSSMCEKQGLRERKKAATRQALSTAAMRLAMERGVEHVTADAIAAAADVSPRTFHNYFSSKEEAIVSTFLDQATAVIDALRHRPAEEPIWDSLEHAIVGMLASSEASPAEMVAQLQLIKSSPALVGHQLNTHAELERGFAQVIADRTGTDVDHDLYPHLLAAAAGAAMAVATSIWVDGTTDRPLEELTAEAFALMRAGVPAPPRQLVAAATTP